MAKKYIKTYHAYFNLMLGEPVMSELTGRMGTSGIDIHHIDAPGMGSNHRDHAPIENLMALTREEHIIYGDNSQYMDFLIDAHAYYMEYQMPYLHQNPHHVGFDALLKTEFKDTLKQLRWKASNSFL